MRLDNILGNVCPFGWLTVCRKSTSEGAAPQLVPTDDALDWSAA